jgi:hypothetical protein
MSRHDNQCWDCGQIGPDITVTPGDYSAHVAHLRIQAACATEIRSAALSAWSNFMDAQPHGFDCDTVHAFRLLLKWVAPDYMNEFEAEVRMDREYRMARLARDQKESQT